MTPGTIGRGYFEEIAEVVNVLPVSRTCPRLTRSCCVMASCPLSLQTEDPLTVSDIQTDTYFISAGILVRFLVREPDAGYSLVEALVGPGAGPPPNCHSADDEAFYVLNGTFEFGVKGLRRTSQRRVDFVAGYPMVRSTRSETPAKSRGMLLIVNAPGTLHVNFFSQAGDPMPPGTTELPSPLPPPDVARLLEAGQRNGMEFVIYQG